MNESKLVSKISPPIDVGLAQQLVDEYESLERRYVLREWEPATLDGGQFAEIASRILYHQDSGVLNLSKPVGECLRFVEDPANSHVYPEQRSARHLCAALRLVYKLRSDRGAVHIHASYSANQLDAKLVVEVSRWVLAEILRVFWTGDRVAVARAVEELVRHELPIIGEYGGRLLVQRTDLTAEQEILLLLYDAGTNGLTRRDLGRNVPRAPSTITEALKKLASPARRQAVSLGSGRYVISDPGIRRVRSELSPLLT